MIFQNLQSDQIFVLISPTYSCPVTYVDIWLLMYVKVTKCIVLSELLLHSLADQEFIEN